MPSIRSKPTIRFAQTSLSTSGKSDLAGQKFLESVIVNYDFLGKNAALSRFSGKGSQALSFKPFQIYFRNGLCW
tara:strand:+ start:1137 stop:1358 length:222 start_codon:yes stop_codon:yes gene_type:complete